MSKAKKRAPAIVEPESDAAVVMAGSTQVLTKVLAALKHISGASPVESNLEPVAVIEGFTTKISLDRWRHNLSFLDSQHVEGEGSLHLVLFRELELLRYDLDRAMAATVTGPVAVQSQLRMWAGFRAARVGLILERVLDIFTLHCRCEQLDDKDRAVLHQLGKAPATRQDLVGWRLLDRAGAHMAAATADRVLSKLSGLLLIRRDTERGPWHVTPTGRQQLDYLADAAKLGAK